MNITSRPSANKIFQYFLGNVIRSVSSQLDQSASEDILLSLNWIYLETADPETFRRCDSVPVCHCLVCLGSAVIPAAVQLYLVKRQLYRGRNVNSAFSTSRRAALYIQYCTSSVQCAVYRGCLFYLHIAYSYRR